MKEYSPTVNRLFSYNVKDINQQWPDYITDLKLDESHIPELIELVQNRNLDDVTSGCTTTECTPMHAWRALGQLKAVEAIQPLFNELIDSRNSEALYFGIELSDTIGLMGAGAIEQLESFLKNAEVRWDSQVTAVKALVIIAKNIPTERITVINILKDILRDYVDNSISYNAYILKGLSQLDARKEVSDLALEVVEANRLDYEYITPEEFEKLIEG